MERLGLMGGTFDPVHIGHLAAACEARRQCGLARVLFVVAGDPWQKRGAVTAPAEDRFAMVTAALADLDGCEATRLEIDRPGPTYTIDTVEALQRRADEPDGAHEDAPDREIVLILGADAAAKIDSWHRSDDLRDLVTLAVVDRDDADAPAPPSGWRTMSVAMPRLEISSSDIRSRIAAHAPFEYMMPPAAVQVVRERGLYTGA